ncbi:hypothetical protein DPMN_041500 [Dreissena polymorpha]|uniref:Uncharacterized protein n=1 Tax=Dreissena polymorpha TaxID=45954 RepID=A0A9D4HTZ1_DREPO|nr:hypothetical protein DPMN_041500 [Dreissena polymorpha]
MESFKNDMKRLWVVHDERVEKVEERVSHVKNKVEGSDIHVMAIAVMVQLLE